MLLFLAPSLMLLTLFIYFIIKPLVEYFYDAKHLRRFPNQNFFSGITNLGYIYERCRGFRTRNLYDVHKRNPIVRLGPNALSFSDVKAIKDIYGHSTSCIKGDDYRLQAGPHSHLLNTLDKEDHSRKRRIVSHAFATRNLEGWEDKVADKTLRLVQQFDKSCVVASSITTGMQSTIDFRKWTNLFTIDAIADIGLSYRTNCLDAGNDLVTIQLPDGTQRQVSFIESLHGGNRANSILVWSYRWFHVLRKCAKYVSPWFRSQYLHGDRYGDIVKHLVRVRMEQYQSGENLEDFFRFWMEDKNGTSHNLPLGEIEAEVSVMMDAGSDTTAIALTNAMYILLKHPSKLAALRQELDAALSDEEIIAPYSKVKNLPYLRACLDESLRVMPPVAFGLSRKTPAEGASILGQWIPGNTTVSVPAYVAHRDPVHFPNPEEYQPERWFEGQAKEAQQYFIPFSTGARGCIGRNISYLEQQVLLATLVRRYDFSLPHRCWEMEREEAFNLWPGPMPLKIETRRLSKVEE